MIDRTLFVTAADAKKLIDALQGAIKGADAETARRDDQKARREKREEAHRLRAAQREREERRKKPKAATTSKVPKEVSKQPKPTLEPTTVATKPAPQERVPVRPRVAPKPHVEPSATEPSDERRGEAIAAALNELRETNRARLKTSGTVAKRR